MEQPMVTPPAVLVLGIGNLLWADEGFGVRAIEALKRAYRFPDNVTLMDGATRGLTLVPYLAAADILVVFDAVDFGLPPGSLKSLEDDAIPELPGAGTTSLHQQGFPEAYALVAALGKPPGHRLLIGIQPVGLDDFGGDLRPAVQRQIEPAIEMARAYLERLGVTAIRQPCCAVIVDER
jgi:hydrogenase maturation protease